MTMISFLQGFYSVPLVQPVGFSMTQQNRYWVFVCNLNYKHLTKSLVCTFFSEQIRWRPQQLCVWGLNIKHVADVVECRKAFKITQHREKACRKFVTKGSQRALVLSMNILQTHLCSTTLNQTPKFLFFQQTENNQKSSKILSKKSVIQHIFSCFNGS